MFVCLTEEDTSGMYAISQGNPLWHGDETSK